MKAALGLGFLGVFLGVVAAGLIKWTLDGATEWVVLEREEALKNGHRESDEIVVE